MRSGRKCLNNQENQVQPASFPIFCDENENNTVKKKKGLQIHCDAPIEEKYVLLLLSKNLQHV